MKKQPIRIIHSKDTEYILLQDRMYTTEERLSNDPFGSYRLFHLSTPSLSRSGMRRIFKLKNGQAGRAGRWTFHVSADEKTVKIGCQTFRNENVLALKRWVGIL